MPTRKRQQLDINLSNVKDAGVRAALTTLVEHVNKLTQDIIVSGEVAAETFKTHNNKFHVLKSGKFKCDAINVNDGGFLKIATSAGSIASLADHVVATPGTTQIVGVFGFATRANDNTKWRPIDYDYPSGQGIRFESGTTCGTSNTVRLVSNDATDTNLYRLVIFYVESGPTA